MPSWKELKRFCESDNWELYKDTDHYFYMTVILYGLKTPIKNKKFSVRKVPSCFSTMRRLRRRKQGRIYFARSLGCGVYPALDEDGNIRKTKVSKGSGEIPKNLWNTVLKKQLQVSKEYFSSKTRFDKMGFLDFKANNIY